MITHYTGPDPRPVFATKAEAFTALAVALKQRSPGDPFKLMPAKVSKAELAEFLADTLCETEPEPIAKIQELVVKIGQVPAFNLLRMTNEVEASGGRFLKGKGRRQTPGGVWFSLVRRRLDRIATDDNKRQAAPKTAKPVPKPVAFERQATRVPEVMLIRRRAATGGGR